MRVGGGMPSPSGSATATRRRPVVVITRHINLDFPDVYWHRRRRGRVSRFQMSNLEGCDFALVRTSIAARDLASR